MKFDVVVIGGGRSGMAKATELASGGLRTALVCKGRSLYGFDPSAFEKAGGILFMDAAVSGEISGGKVVSVFTEKLGSTPLEAEKYFLATGKFFAGGIVADMDRAYEPIFGLDVRYEQDREKWFSENFADAQPFMEFGVVVDEAGCAVKGGESVVNLFPIGEILAK